MGNGSFRLVKKVWPLVKLCKRQTRKRVERQAKRERQTDGQTDRQTETEPERDRDTEKERERGSDTERQTERGRERQSQTKRRRRVQHCGFCLAGLGNYCSFPVLCHHERDQKVYGSFAWDFMYAASL